MGTMTRSLGIAALATVLGFLAPATTRADVVYNQPFDGTGNLYASQNDTTPGGYGLFAQVYDNFTLSSATVITSAGWTGGYYNPPSQGPITAWTVDIYADNSGTPGSLLSNTYVAGTANETFLGNYGGSPIYTYSLSLATPFAAAAGTQYWLSVYPDLGFPPQWGWASGTGGDGISYQNFQGTLSQLTTDMAFSLSSVPEPSSLVLAAMGGMGIVVLYGRRRRPATA